jgi:putative zinc finger/helix-turn-helix YgiT family protein
MSKVHRCAFCNSAHTHEVTYSESFKMGRKQLEVTGMKKMVCEKCESEFVPANLMDANLQCFKAAEASAILVSPGMLRTLREMWGLSQKEASQLFGAGASSFGKWESNQTNMSTPTALLIKSACHMPELVPYLAKLANVTLKTDSHGYQRNKDVSKRIERSAKLWDNRALGASAEYVAVADASHDMALGEALALQTKAA